MKLTAVWIALGAAFLAMFLFSFVLVLAGRKKAADAAAQAGSGPTQDNEPRQV